MGSPLLLYKIWPHEIQRTFPWWPGWPQVICTGMLKEVQLLCLGCLGISNGLISHSSSGDPSGFLMTHKSRGPACLWLTILSQDDSLTLRGLSSVHFSCTSFCDQGNKITCLSHWLGGHSCKTDSNPDTRGNHPGEVIKRKPIQYCVKENKVKKKEEVIIASNLTLSRNCPSISWSMIC